MRLSMLWGTVATMVPQILMLGYITGSVEWAMTIAITMAIAVMGLAVALL